MNFIEALCHTKGTWWRQPFKLLDWQEQIIRDLFGTIKPNGYRQFNTAYIEIPKKMLNVDDEIKSFWFLNKKRWDNINGNCNNCNHINVCSLYSSSKNDNDFI